MNAKLVIIGAILGTAACGSESAGDRASAVEASPSNSAAAEAPGTPMASILSVREIAGKTPSQVSAVLGAPSSQETIRNGGQPYTKRSYRDGDIEIVYVDERTAGLRACPESPAIARRARIAGPCMLARIPQPLHHA